MRHLRLLSIAVVAFGLVFTSGLSAAAGDLDPTFDGDGKVITDFGGRDEAFDMAIQTDGKIVAVGSTYDPATAANRFALARYNKNGSPDPGFGAGGKVLTEFGPSRSSASASAVAIQRDGKIVVAGGAFVRGVSVDSDFALARYNSDGTLDATFGGSGKVVTNLQRDDYARGLAIQADGKIVVVGSTRATTTGVDYDFAIARFNPNGSLDSGFGGRGFVSTAFSGDDGAASVLIQANRKIVAVGVSNGRDFALARYNADGSMDGTFDGDGKVETQGAVLEGASSVAIQRDGKLVVAGGLGIVARYNTNGDLDAGFGENGQVQLLPGAGTPQPDIVLVQPDRKLVVVGTASPSESYDFRVARLNPDGSIDYAFGSDGDGMVFTDFGANSWDFPQAAALQSDSRIVVAGYTHAAGGPDDFALARYQNPAPCKVPNVRGKKLAPAKSAIRKARCSVGKISRKPSKRSRKGRVLSQRPKAGTILAVGGKVNLVVGKGPQAITRWSR